LKGDNKVLKDQTIVETTLGKKPLDTSGSPVAAARMDPAQGYGENIFLIQKYINEGSEDAWEEIRQRLDAYIQRSSALDSLERKPLSWLM
jgi:hypothetical protein